MSDRSQLWISLLSSFEPEALLAVCEQGLCSIIFQILFGYPYSAAWSNDSSSSIGAIATGIAPIRGWPKRSEEHTSELQTLLRISYAVFCLNKTTTTNNRSQ